MARTRCGSTSRRNSIEGQNPRVKSHNASVPAVQVLVKAYGADAVRYYFMSELEFGKQL